MTTRGRATLRELGLEALIDLIETTAYGVCVTGDDHTWVYLNPAGAALMGRPFRELEGRDYLLHFPEHERDVLLRLEADQRAGDTEFYVSTVVRPDGSEREMTWSGTVVRAADGTELAPAIFHETTKVRRAQRAAATAARWHESGVDRCEVLQSLVREVTGGSRAIAAALLVEDRSGVLEVAAASGTDPGLADLVAASKALVSDLPGTDDLAGGRSVYLSDAADRWRRGERTAAWAPALSRDPWAGMVLIGFRSAGALAGCLLVVLPPGLIAPSEAEVAFWCSSADQAGVALGADLIRRQVSRRSVDAERSRIARDLHDSVSQALFSLHARAQVIRRALDGDDPDLAREAAQDLELLSRQATAELRELVAELRPGHGRDCPVDATLADLLTAVAADVTRLDGLPVDVSFSPARLPALPAPLVEHLPRLVREALHNVVKHADATRAELRVSADRHGVEVAVSDDGRGFDLAVSTGGFGQQTMRERARLCGGVLEVRSSPGAGTVVLLRTPLR
ncbi:PAS domain-containing sensor histidine kinase [Nocardioides ferulae]|uniref:PAS domain-containing sensor histidine kinase n=1 Tax=Nocardioides ferulae TaxID=2340821 RepID=UPI0013DDA5FB|nr:PAS domain-containing sensor histidine kinase [Nocardioides ferulae]